MAESQALTVLADTLYDDPSQLSQALRQRAGSDKPLHFTTSTESHHSGNTASAFTVSPQLSRALVPQQPPVVLARVDHAPSSRRVATANYVKPALPQHHSAPTSTGIVAEVVGAYKMHHSFSVMDAPGDTQPDSQMHKQWTSGVFPTVEANNRPVSLFTEHVDEEEEENDLPTDEVRASQSSQQRNNPTVTSPTVFDIDDRAPAEQHSLALTSPLKFETPALAGRKRDNSGQMLSSAARSNETPGTVVSASAFFPVALGNGAIAGGPLMSLTQAWQNTQAPTSPAVGGASEDVVFTRPSPNFTNARHSSPIPAYSSPIKAIRPETPKSDPVIRSSSEPRAEYVTMKQSQEKRKLSTGDERVTAVEQDSWQELSVKMKRRKAKEQFHQRAARSLSNISAPTPLVPRSGRKRAVNAKSSSPVRLKTPRRIAHADPEGEEDDDSMDELLRPTPRKRHDAEDSPDELSQDVPFKARTTVKYNSNDNRVQVPKTSSHPHRTPSGQALRQSSQHATPSSQLQRESRSRPPGSQPRLRDTLRPSSSKDSVAIMDSQPDATADYQSIPQPKSLRFPSSPSTNEYSINQTTMATKTGYTSQVISSSMPPLPPRSSPTPSDDVLNEEVMADEAERVPSSPPILTDKDAATHEEEIEYDEHAYDEYGADVENHGENEPSVVDDDILMDEDEDLPVANQLPDQKAVAGKEVDVADDDELDLVQPEKVDLGTDEAVPSASLYVLHEKQTYRDEDSSKAVEYPHPPRMQRQNTVPETDALDETQPSCFPDNVQDDLASRTEMANHTNSTEPFQTAQEEQHGSQSNRPAPLSSREEGSDLIQLGNRIRSINDVHNLPATQQSIPEEEIEMPRLSGLDEEDPFLPRSSPAPPSAKRRKVTYTAKRKAFRSPVKPLTDSEPLSDPPPSSPLDGVQEVLADTPPKAPAREQEKQGGLAVVSTGGEAPYARPATRKPAGLPRSLKAQAQRKGALKPITRELLQSLSSPNKSPSKLRGSLTSRASTPPSPSRRRADAGDAQTNIDMIDVDNETDELAGPTPQTANVDSFVEIASNRDTTPSGNVLVPNRVFASWPGSHYYPATCIGRSTSRQLQVRFDDGNDTSLDAVHVRALSLRTGDHVKVDEAGMKKNTYVVVGFKDKIDDLGGEEYPTTDQLGFATIVLEEKRRDSLPAAKAILATEQVSVPMASIYLTTGLWTRLRDRSFNFSPPTSPNKATSRIGTPVIDPLATPSFTRRGTTAPSLLKDVTGRAASVASTARSGTSVFSNMAFVLTSTAADVDKDAIAKLIKSNGGQVLEHGFHELFDYESAEATSSQSRRRSISADEGSVGLALKHTRKDLGFVALISDSHSRSTKYIQALALNVPCLHLRWIQDSLAAARALSFAKYLLPAGVSKFLDPNGVLRSRTMSIYDPAGDDVSFAQTIQERDLLLHNQAVLLVTGKSKKEMERRQPFIFLTHALGSANVGRCADLAAAAQMLTEGQWDWVYVDNGERGVAEAAAELFGRTNGAKSGGAVKAKKGKKRKADESDEREELVARGELAGRKVRITCAEFVIQSLILGALVEE
ncbi:radiation sensitive protein rad9 [Neocucurbitaria cava]|uniref:Radiation sensitive protein rad9 n=1 Tax=Neocucurbitaria cava TaxID=798079 RepID=A0A9W8YH66_9PLEO|nr:radiation sensitive protein rad9 [Neocucurbitaria cava]